MAICTDYPFAHGLGYVLDPLGFQNPKGLSPVILRTQSKYLSIEIMPTSKTFLNINLKI
jgi:hypothetical protein